MVDKNKQFVLNEFEAMADLEIQEMNGWKAVAHRHFTKRPIGDKPYNSADLLIPVSQFSQVLLQNDL
ncbi:hypothetical protein [Kordia sp.]|uniref:hypothetical protein n=1 Tax=Kordia sp. TaxID=1965332 RepID=UPI0025BC91FC|nr:hypothetical protein [Kordia sp.]MCH2195002.1 hypothetical protein [Kordia sp.]